MNILSIDTSTKNLSLAVSVSGKVLRYRNMILEKVLESSIVPAIDHILRSAGITFDRLDGFAVGLGPGSFTSLRVGLSTVKAFALATGKPVVGIPSLDVVAMNVADQKADQICVIMDARRGQIYAGLYILQNGQPVRKTDYLLTNIDEILGRVEGRVVFAGDALPLCKETIAAFSRRKNAFKPVWTGPKMAVAQARKLSGLAYRRFAKKEYDDVERLLPLYLYSQDCQVDRGQK